MSDNPLAACEHGRQRRKCEICELSEAEKRISELEQELAEARQEIERCHAVMKVTCPSIEDLKQERDRLQSMVDAQVAELNAISEALGTYDGHSSVTHINILRERLAALEGK